MNDASVSEGAVGVSEASGGGAEGASGADADASATVVASGAEAQAGPARSPETTVVVTGATSGLGRAAAEALVRAPHLTVVVAARDPRRGERVAAELNEAAIATARAVALPLDLASLDSVRAFPGALDRAGLPPLRAVAANAGMQRTDRRHVTADGFEETFGTNHLGHFLLIRLLLERLIDHGRVVIVSSGTHKPQRLRNFGFPPPRWAPARVLATPGDGSGQVAYATSKLANAMTALELSRRIETLRPGARIAVHAFDPGLMPATGLAQHYPAPARRAYSRLAPLLTRLPGATTAERSGELLAGIAIDHRFDDRPNGRYVEWDGGEGAYSAQARDARAAAELWRDSEQLVGLAAS